MSPFHQDEEAGAAVVTVVGPDANAGMEVDNEPEEHQAGVYVVLIFGQFLPRLVGVSSLILFI